MNAIYYSHKHLMYQFYYTNNIESIVLYAYMYIIRINVIRIFEQFEIQTEARFFLEENFGTIQKFQLF